MKVPVLNLIDFYKADHRSQYPEKTQRICSNLTARKSRLDGVNEIVFFGLQYFIKEYLQTHFNKTFFNVPKTFVVNQYKRRLENSLGKNIINYKHIEDLHDLGYLPVEILAVPEATLVPIGVPCLVIMNTKPEFFWLTNYLETLLSCVIWQPITSATISWEYRKLLSKFAKQTVGNDEFVQYQAHDFSHRGMSSVESALVSGAAHLLSFIGTDTVPAIDFLEDYYGADSDFELIGCSVRATEHSVQSCGGKETELETYDRLITKVYPDGIVSIVSDTYDYWGVLTGILPQLKEKILSRNGKLVIRPDSGTPEDIICGTCREFGQGNTPEEKGSIELLFELFGGTYSEKGYRLLNDKIGLIYGDSITLNRAKEICERLEKKGFASTNVVLGVGSYSFQFNTRDTFGMAVKCTFAEIDGKKIEVYKDPKTDNGMKKSAKGLTAVFRNAKGKLYLKDQATWSELYSCELKPVFRDGQLLQDFTLADIRKRLLSNLC